MSDVSVDVILRGRAAVLCQFLFLFLCACAIQQASAHERTMRDPAPSPTMRRKRCRREQSVPEAGRQESLNQICPSHVIVPNNSVWAADSRPLANIGVSRLPSPASASCSSPPLPSQSNCRAGARGQARFVFTPRRG